MDTRFSHRYIVIPIAHSAHLHATIRLPIQSEKVDYWLKGTVQRDGRGGMKVLSIIRSPCKQWTACAAYVFFKIKGTVSNLCLKLLAPNQHLACQGAGVF